MCGFWLPEKQALVCWKLPCTARVAFGPTCCHAGVFQVLQNLREPPPTMSAGEHGCERCCAPTITRVMAKCVMQTLALQWRLTPAHLLVTLGGFCQGLFGEKRRKKIHILQKKIVVAIDLIRFNYFCKQQ